MTSTAASLTLASEAEAAPSAPSTPSTEGGDEAAWVLAARSGDADATLRLLGRYRPPLVRLLTGLTGDRALAEDVAQEAFLQAFRSLRQLRDPGAFYGWVRRLATRHALRALRRRRPPGPPLDPALPAGDNPAREVETRLAVEGVLRALPPDLRAVLVLREMEQLDYEEIAETLGVPVGTVRSRLFTARERFRKAWSEMEADGC